MSTRATSLTLAAIVFLSSCGSSDTNQTQTDSTAPAQSAVSNDRAENACRLLKGEEVSAILEHRVVIADQAEAEPGYSVCNWEDRDGMAVFQLKVYWRGGRQMWSVWRTAQGMSEEILKKEEGVGLDSIVEQGPVPGIGDAAYFSPLLPSLLLKDDVLIEITNPIGKRPEAKFRGMAEKILSRI